jgi:hypothetical protein
MGLVNHLRTVDGQNLFHAIAYGKHLVSGNLAKSIVTGTSPSHTIKLQQMLGRGEWDACEGLWFKGIEVTNYHFYPGIQSTGMADVTQGQDTVFDTDTPHSLIAWIRAQLPVGLGDADTTASPPDGIKGIFRTSLIHDYDTDGSSSDYGYSASPAREVADLIIRIGKRPTSRIDWPAWCDWRNYLAEDITYDYTALDDFDGFGLTTSLYNGAAFDTLISTRIDPVLEFPLSSGSPGIGVNVDNFSVRWEGKIKALYTETYTFYVTHDDGAKLWVNGTLVVDNWTTYASDSGTIAMTAGTFVDIKVEWKDTGGNAEFRLEWQSTTQTREVVTHRCLYPKTTTRPRYETHPFFSGPTRLDDAVRTILNLCNSTVQEVGGKLRFMCLEQQTASVFSFTNANIVDGSASVRPRDVRNLRNSWQAHFRDIDSQYLETPIDPILIERADLISAAGRKIDGEAIELYNCSVHQAYRTLENIVKREVDSPFQITMTGNADTWPVLAGDRCDADVEFLDWTNKDMLVIESDDQSSEQSADERTFTVQQWPDFDVYT